jgi:hypothetical protein
MDLLIVSKHLRDLRILAVSAKICLWGQLRASHTGYRLSMEPDTGCHMSCPCMGLSLDKLEIELLDDGRICSCEDDDTNELSVPSAMATAAVGPSLTTSAAVVAVVVFAAAERLLVVG